MFEQTRDIGFGRQEKYSLVEQRNTLWQSRETKFSRAEKYSLVEQRNTVWQSREIQIIARWRQRPRASGWQSVWEPDKGCRCVQQSGYATHLPWASAKNMHTIQIHTTQIETQIQMKIPRQRLHSGYSISLSCHGLFIIRRILKATNMHFTKY